jgi:tripartite-type tricarboxylate transporter receptor subunit TctC
MNSKTLPQALAAVAILAFSWMPQHSLADEAYPSRAVKLVVAQAAGGGPDLLARVVAQELSAQWRQPIIVENKAGAAGGIAAEFVARSPADGYTLLIGSAGIMSIAPALENKLPYSPDEFVPLVHLSSLSNVLVVNSSSPVKSIRALMEAARKAPAGLSVGSMGAGSTGQISGEMLVRQTGIKIVEVAYKGESLALTDLRGGARELMAAGGGGGRPPNKTPRRAPQAGTPPSYPGRPRDRAGCHRRATVRVIAGGAHNG